MHEYMIKAWSKICKGNFKAKMCKKSKLDFWGLLWPNSIFLRVNHTKVRHNPPPVFSIVADRRSSSAAPPLQPWATCGRHFRRDYVLHCPKSNVPHV